MVASSLSSGSLLPMKLALGLAVLLTATVAGHASCDRPLVVGQACAEEVSECELEEGQACKSYGKV